MNYPDGMPSSYDAPILHRCRECGFEFEVVCNFDFGTYEPIESDSCRNCGSNDVEVL